MEGSAKGKSGHEKRPVNPLVRHQEHAYTDDRNRHDDLPSRHGEAREVNHTTGH